MFPSHPGKDEAKRIALLRSHGFAVLAVGDHGIVHELGHGHAARETAGVRTFGEHPFCLRLHTDFVEKCGNGNAGPFAATDEARSELGSSAQVTDVLALSVAGALEEMRARDGRHTLEIFDLKNHRTIDEPMNEQFVRGGIDIRHAGMVAFVMKRRRRDGAVQVLQRREARAGGFQRRIRNARGFFKGRAFTVGAHGSAEFGRDGVGLEQRQA